MEFEVGKLYKNASNGAVVKCTIANGWKTGYFAGVLVNKGASTLSEGAEFADWNKGCFEEYHEPKEVITTLQNGHKYSIPKGCKATIEDGFVIIEEDIRYYKFKFNTYNTYFKCTAECIIYVTIYKDGRVEISSHTSGNFNHTFFNKSTKEEFEKAFNKAMEVLKS